MDGGAHDGFGKDVEKVGADSQDTFDTGGHEGRRDDEAATGTDTAGDEAGGQADSDGGQEDGRGVEGRRVRRFATQHLVGVIGFGAADDQNRHRERQQEQHLLVILKDGSGDLQIPFGICLGSGDQHLIHGFPETHELPLWS